jgi:exodeoxyribonuclease III
VPAGFDRRLARADAGIVDRLAALLSSGAAALKTSTFNVNGINGRLPRLLEWLAETTPDIACPQEIKTSDERFPQKAIEAVGYGALWRGQPAHHGVAILSRGETLREVRRDLPGDDSDTQARCLAAEAHGVRIASLYLPNGNPQPGPKFDYKLAGSKGSSGMRRR